MACSSIQSMVSNSGLLTYSSVNMLPVKSSNFIKMKQIGKKKIEVCKAMVQQTSSFQGGGGGGGASATYAKEMERLSAKESLLLAKVGKKVEVCRAIVQQMTVQGASATYAKEMERVSAKESLLIAFKDAGGFEALIGGRTSDMQKIDVNERIVGLERLNPTPRPTTSPFLEGRWNFEWIGYGSPGLFAARLLSERFPTTLANLFKMDLVIKEGYAKITANMKFLNAIENNFILSTKLTVEGPLRMKEEYTEGVLETPSVDEETIPQQLKGALGQAVNTMQQLPSPVKDAVSGGLRIPLNGAFQRLFMISYLDEKILIIRDASGVPEVLTRLDIVQLPSDPIEEYES